GGTRAAAYSPQIATKVSDPGGFGGLVLRSKELVVAFDRSGAVKGDRKNGVDGVDEAKLHADAAWTRAASGFVTTSLTLRAGGLDIAGISPVFRPGGTRRASDVIGVIAIVRAIGLDEVSALARSVESGTEVALVNARGNGTSS